MNATVFSNAADRAADRKHYARFAAYDLMDLDWDPESFEVFSGLVSALLAESKRWAECEKAEFEETQKAHRIVLDMLSDVAFSTRHHARKQGVRLASHTRRMQRVNGAFYHATDRVARKGAK